jgi:Fe2+ or Zn2+ uptake regulation protein
MAIILKSAGLTLTTSRINISHHLAQTSIPSSALELSKLLNIPLSTTHRNLSSLAYAGLANNIIDRSGISRWFWLVAGKVNFCPCCNQEFMAHS